MRIHIQVTKAEIEEMDCDSLEEFKERIIQQLDEGIVTDDGGAGGDWMVEYQLDVSVS